VSLTFIYIRRKRKRFTLKYIHIYMRIYIYIIIIKSLVVKVAFNKSSMSIFMKFLKFKFKLRALITCIINEKIRPCNIYIYIYLFFNKKNLIAFFCMLHFHIYLYSRR
jgi:hypothetical protein